MGEVLHRLLRLAALMIRLRLAATAFALAFATLLGSCVAGDSPVAPVANMAAVAIVPRFAVAPAADAPTINRIRLTAYAQGTPPTVLATAEIDVDPGATEWDVTLEVPVGSGAQSVYILVELIHVEGGVATVEYSGTTPSFTLSSGPAPVVQQVDVVRGPAENLSVTSVTVSPDTATILEGDSVALQASVTTSGSGSSTPVVYWSSLDPQATVSAAGVVTGLLPGVARIVARSGTPTDTARVLVRAIPRSVRISPDTAQADSLGAILTFTASVLDARNAPIAGQALVWRSLAPDLLASQGGGVFRTVRPGLATVEALVAADTTLRAQAVAVTALALVDVAVAKSADRASAFVGDTIRYTVTVRNEGAGAVDGVAVVEALPGNGALVVATTDVGSYDGQTNRWTLGRLELGAEAHLTVLVRATAAGPADNTVRLDGDALETDGIPGNNQATASVTVADRVADLSLTKTASRTSALDRDTVNFTVTVSNAGPFAVDSVVVGDELPSQLTLLSATASQGSYAGGAWTVGNLSSGASATLTVRTRIQDGVSDVVVQNVAEVLRSSGATDPDSDDRRATASVSVGRRTADLSVAKTVNKASATEGDTVTFTVTVANAGPYAMDNIVLIDSVPHLFTVPKYTMTQGSADTLTGTWSVGSLAAGASATLTLVTALDVGSGGSVWTNVARITSYYGADDPDSDDHRATASVDVAKPLADLSVAKTVDKASATVGDTVTFTVTLSNAGPKPAMAISVADQAASGLQLLSQTLSQGTWADSVWTAGTVASGASATATFKVLLTAGSGGKTVTNKARIKAFSGAVDPDTLDHYAEASVAVGFKAADLSLAGSAGTAKAIEGGTLVFSVVLTNLGPGTATGITSQAFVSANLHLDSARVSRGAVDSGTGIWTLDSLKADASENFKLFTTVLAGSAGGSAQGQAAILSSSPLDPSTGNNTTSVVVPIAGPDLKVTKTVDLTAPNVTQDVTFSLEVQNPSGTKATGVNVTDVLPAGLTFVSASVENYDSGTGVWNVGDLPGGGSAQLQIKAKPTKESRGTTVVNKAKLTASTPSDPNPVNDTASATVMPVNQAPTANAQSVSTPETTPILIQLSAADLDGDSLVFSIVTAPTEGTLGAFTDLKRTGASVTYTPTYGKWGTFPFTFQVSDGVATANAVVTVTVTEVARARSFTTPGNTQLLAGPGATDPGTPHVYRVEGLLPAGTTLQVTNLGCTPAGLTCSDALGERTASADGTFTFRPARGVKDATTTYTYQTNTGGSASLTLVISANLVWYVDASYSGTATGRSWEPYGTLAQVESTGGDIGPAPALDFGGPSWVAGGASSAGDILYVSAGTYAEGINLDANQTLAGAASDLIVDGEKLAGVGTRPTVQGPIALAAGTTVQGFMVDGSSGDGIVGTSTNVKLKNLRVQNTAADGIELNGGTGGAVLDTVTVSVSGTDARGLAVVDVTGSVTATNMSVTASGDGPVAAVEVSQGAPVFSYTGTATAAASASLTPFTLINVNSTTTAADIAFLGGPYTAVADTAARFRYASGDIRVDGLVIDPGTGVGVSIITSDTATAPGSFDFNDLDINDVDYTAFRINGGHPTVDAHFASSSLHHTSNDAPAIYVTSTNGADIDFSGGPIDVSSNGRGILLEYNTGSTITFHNRLNLSTGSARAIEANNGGTLVVMDATDNDITTTTEKAIYLNGVSIGSSGMTLRSVSSDGAPNGVYLMDAGSGPFTITGSGSTPGSGGTIKNSTDEGIYVEGSNALTLKNLNIQGNRGGLHAQYVTGLSVDNATFLQNQYNGEGWEGAGIYLMNIAGTATVSNSTISQSGYRGIQLYQDSGTPALVVSNTVVESTVSGVGIDLSVTEGADVEVTLTGNTIEDNAGLGLDVSTYSNGILDLTVGGAGALANTFLGNDAGEIRLDISSGTTTKLTFDIDNNTFDGPQGNAVVVATSSYVSGTLEGNIRNNTVMNSLNSGGSGHAIRIEVPDGVGVISVTNNTMGSSGTPLASNERGVGVQVGGGSTGQLDLTIKDNSIFTAAPGGDAPGVYVEQSDPGPVCLNLVGNDVTGVWSEYYPFQFSSSLSSAFKLDGGFSGSTAADAAVFLATINKVNGDSATTGHFGLSGSFTGGTCALPSNAPPA